MRPGWIAGADGSLWLGQTARGWGSAGPAQFGVERIVFERGARPREILYALAMGSGGRVHSRLGGLLKENVSVHDGQR